MTALDIVVITTRPNALDNEGFDVLDSRELVYCLRRRSHDCGSIVAEVKVGRRGEGTFRAFGLANTREP